MQVRFFAVKKGGHPKAYFYLDPYSRPAEKRGGAWCAHARFHNRFALCSAFWRLPMSCLLPLPW
jgi:oligopeptidase A